MMGISSFFFFNDTATTEIYTLSLHDALPICPSPQGFAKRRMSASPNPLPGRLVPLHAQRLRRRGRRRRMGRWSRRGRSEEHTSELQSRQYLVCRLLLEKKNNTGKS